MRHHSMLKVAAAFSLAMGLYAACSSNGGSPLPCTMVGIVKCGTTCKIDSDCGAGLYCNNSKCSANCVAGGTSCGAGQVCDGTGRCVASSGGDGGGPVVQCPADLMCNVSCSGGGTTTISGKVYDPAGKNGLFNVSVFVPATALTPLPKGVPTGADACSCAALYPSGALVSTSTAEDGTFTLSNVPVGANGAKVPFVIQVGKWRRLYHFDVASCQDNPQPDKSLAFPSTVAATDTDDSIPDIAVSTGSADTLECLMRRIGLSTNEYVAGAAGDGHVHVFSGGTNAGGGGGGARPGRPENPIMPGAPVSSTNLWSTQAQLMPYDIVLLSCEGGETYNANPPALEAYLNAGGRVFASHFHYAWFAGPLDTQQNYSAPADWGTNLATWVAGGGQNNGVIGGLIDTTLNGSTMPFPKGVSLQKWLGNVNALGRNGVPAAELSIYQPRFNSTVAATNKPSQPWITADPGSGMSGSTMYLSFDTPVNPPLAPDNSPMYCGRAVFSDLHVAGDPTTNDNPPPPNGCTDSDLSPQEKALEFMLFDLSSCVVPDSVAPPMGVPLPLM
ncbi:MAG TPA: hypothetical protein VFF06_14535 [Polyangia bacterium]|nr:hypothetical protein [Polyangia bacterium]